MSRIFIIFLPLVICIAATGYGSKAGYLPASAIVDSLVVIKHSRTMLVFEHGILLKKYKIALGKQPVGTKHFEGDMRTPEGLYYINGKNAQSAYHKNLGISYPNSSDRLFARKAGKPTGGDIKIHGLRNDQAYLGRFHTITDWTDGCIALSNDEIDELFVHINTGIPIYILP